MKQDISSQLKKELKKQKQKGKAEENKIMNMA